MTYKTIWISGKIFYILGWHRLHIIKMFNPHKLYYELKAIFTKFRFYFLRNLIFISKFIWRVLTCGGREWHKELDEMKEEETGKEGRGGEGRKKGEGERNWYYTMHWVTWIIQPSIPELPCPYHTHTHTYIPLWLYN